MPRYDDEVFRGLGRPQLGINDILHDEESSPRRFTRSVPVQVSPEMYQAIQEIVAHRNLPFNGNMSAFVRHALGITLEQLEEFLAEDSRTIYRALVAQQRRMTRERFVVTIEDSIDQQVDLLRFWTAKGKWAEVVRSMEAFVNEVAEYPVVAWREHAAGMWLRNAALKEQLHVWEQTMKNDSQADWANMQRQWRRMERMANE